MRLLSISLAAVLTLAAFSAANAQDTNRRTPGTFWVGAELGYERVSDTLDGFTYGLRAGYDHDLSDLFFIGLEFGVFGTEGDEPGGVLFGNQASLVDFDYQYLSEISARIGYRPIDRLTVFLAPGYIDRNFEIEDSFAESRSFSINDIEVNSDDFQLALGAEYNLTDQFVLTSRVTTNDFDSEWRFLGGLKYNF